MTDSNGSILREPPLAGTEVETLLGSLERQRRTFEWKCSGLDAAGMRATVGASTMTLAGLVKHVALVEAHYFIHLLRARDIGPPWNTVDWDNEPDWEWRTAGEESPEEILALWRETVARSRASVAEVLARGGAEQPIAVAQRDGRTPFVRRLLIDMIEEYARHVGHADLIRESVDGLTGEDPPD